MILVIGATGQLGGLIARSLLDRGEAVRILTRDGSAYDDLRAAGAQPAMGDLKDAPSLAAACAGVDAVVTTATGAAGIGDDTVETVDRLGNSQLIDAAAMAGVRRFVFVSVLGADGGSPVPVVRAKGETEQRLRDSGMAWTILQPDVFMDRMIPAVVGGSALTGGPVTLVAGPERRHSFVAMRDVAAYALAALDQQRAERQTLVIGGPRPISWRDVVAAFEHELGRALEVRTVPPGASIPGLPDFVTGLVTFLNTYDSPIDSADLAEAYGVAPTSLDEFVRGFVAANRLRVK